jgi:hypothetical protein
MPRVPMIVANRAGRCCRLRTFCGHSATFTDTDPRSGQRTGVVSGRAAP